MKLWLQLCLLKKVHISGKEDRPLLLGGGRSQEVFRTLPVQHLPNYGLNSDVCMELSQGWASPEHGSGGVFISMDVTPVTLA